MWATRFYGMEVPPDVELHEELTDRAVTDLVDAHLGINYSYFGAIDKTLSGFVVLDDEGDDYTLFDLRDTGQVYWQDHETRDVVLRHDSLAGYLAKAEAQGPRPTTRAIATAALCERYHWLVWFLARPLTQDGTPTQTVDYLVRNGLGHFRGLWENREAIERAFAAEEPTLAGDPHLAIYWLLHATALADDELRARVVAAIGDGGCELVRAFVARLGRLPASGDLAIIPDFRARRALGLTYGAFELAGEAVALACLHALEVSPHTSSLAHALQVSAALGRIDPTGPAEPIPFHLRAAAVLARIVDVTPGTALVRATLDRRHGATASPHADTLARLLVDASEPWWLALEALWLVHELAYEGPALVAATRRILARDRYHRRALQMAMRAAQIAGQSVDEIERDLAIADSLIAPFQQVVERPGAWEAIAMALLPPLRQPFAWRVLQRAGLNKPVPGLALWAAREVVRGGDALIGEAFAQLDDRTIGAVIAGADRPEDVAVLLAYLDGPEPGPHDVVAKLQLDRGKETALAALAPRVPDPAVFAKLMMIVERPARGGLLNLVWGKLFSPHAKDTYVLPRLDDRQALRAARAMIACNLKHPQIQARNAAGHALYRFEHPGAEAFLIDALTDYGVRYAAEVAATDRRGLLEDVVGNLYAAVRTLGTPGARTALAERLFAERRAYWRMGRALADVWDAALHAQILAMLRDRRDPRAAGAYAYALRDFVQLKEPLVDLVELICDWQGDTEVARGFLHYALVVGIDAALTLGRQDVVRRAHEATAWIAEPPLEPDHHARGAGWVNPLEQPDVAAAVQRVVLGELPPIPPPPPPPVETRTKATSKARSKARSKAAAKPSPAARPTAKAKPRAAVKAKPTAKPRAAVKAKPTAKPEAKPKAKATPKAPAKAKAKPKASAKAKPKASAKAKPKASAKATAKARSRR